MKKIIFLVISVMLLCGLAIGTTSIALAEEVEGQTEQTEVVEEVEEENSGVITEIKDWISNNITKEKINNLIHYLIESGGFIGLIASIIRLGKERKSTKEYIETITEKVVKKVIADKDETQQKEILKNVDELKQTTDTIVKAIVLMQDSTAKGKLALLDLLNVSKEIEVTKVIESTKEVIEEELQKDNEVKDAVKEDYKEVNIF